MRIRTVTLAGALVCLGLAAGASIGLVWVSTGVNVAERNLVAASDLVRGVFELSTMSSEYVLRRNERPLEQWRQRHGSLKALLGDFDAGTAPQDERLGRLTEDHRDIGAIFGELLAVDRLQNEGQVDPERLSQRERYLRSLLLVKSQSMVSQAFALAQASERQLRDNVVITVWLAILLLAGVVAVAFGWWLVVTRRVVGPLLDLRTAMGTFGLRDLAYRIRSERRDEIGELAQAFDEMADRLQRTTLTVDELELTVTARTRDLATSNSELEAFAYSVSHDLRAPLRHVNGYVEALLEDHNDGLEEEAQGYLKRISMASDRMGRLIDDILKLSRISRARIERGPVDLSKLAQEIAAELRSASPQREAEFVVHPGVSAEADERLLRVVLQNLLENAWKYSAPRPRTEIEFGARPANGSLEYFVRDNGVGFDMAYANKLFKPFQRLHAEQEFEGTGIGLATVSRIVSRHGGQVRVESAVGRGTTFYFSL